MENLVINTNFWIGKRVLITGHTGFKGSWLSLWLQSLGAIVVGVSLDPPTEDNIYEKANVGDGMVSLRGDIRDIGLVKGIFKKHKPEIVFHLAAQSLVRYSYKNPVETYEVNVMGTLNVLEGIRSVDSVCAAVIVTTDKCYQNMEWVWGYRENDPMGGHDPYSSSKGAVELLVSSYRNSYFKDQNKTAIASVRAGNVIGGGDWAEDRLVPDIIRAFCKGGHIRIRNPNSIRPWQYVLEPLSGYIKLAEMLTNDGVKYAESWNFGPKDGDVYPVKWIVEKMVEQWGDNVSWSTDEAKHPHEANYLKLDCSKVYFKLNWQPKFSLIQTLQKIVEWHQVELTGSGCRDICLLQIREYMAT
jgi:CDP-glucose 4,6-dehydratase